MPVRHSWDFVRGPAGVRMLVDAGVDAGMTVAQCLAGTGLRPEQLDDAALRVEAGQELAVARNLVAVLGDRPGLGADAGTRLTIGTFGVLSFALLTSATLGEALAIALRFWHLTSAFARVELEPDSGTALLVVHDEEIPDDVRDLLVERDIAASLVVVTMLLGDPGAARMRLQTRLTGERAAALAAVTPAVAVTGGMARNVFAIDAQDLHRALPQADAATRRACEQECIRLLDARSRRAGMAARVRALLLENPTSMPTLTQIAAQMSFDVRTLRRHLAAEGTSYRALRQEVCMTLALELLRTAGLGVAEVATRVGYADPTAFTHAFTRWHGRPPSTVRAAP